MSSAGLTIDPAILTKLLQSINMGGGAQSPSFTIPNSVRPTVNTNMPPIQSNYQGNVFSTPGFQSTNPTNIPPGMLPPVSGRIWQSLTQPQRDRLLMQYGPSSGPSAPAATPVSPQNFTPTPNPIGPINSGSGGNPADFVQQLQTAFPGLFTPQASASPSPVNVTPPPQLPNTTTAPVQPAPAQLTGTATGIDLPYTPPAGTTAPQQIPDQNSGGQLTPSINVIDNATPEQIAGMTQGLFSPQSVGQGIFGAANALNGPSAPAAASSWISPTLTSQNAGQKDPSTTNWTGLLGQGAQLAASLSGIPGLSIATDLAKSGLSGEIGGPTTQVQNSSPNSNTFGDSLWNYLSANGPGLGTDAANMIGNGLFGGPDSSSIASLGKISMGDLGAQIMNQSMQQGTGPNQQASNPSANNFGIFGGSVDQSNPWGYGSMWLMLPGS